MTAWLAAMESGELMTPGDVHDREAWNSYWNNSCSPIHRSEDYPPRGGGSLSHSTGDVVDPEVCPGTYDVLIERRTVQLFGC